MTPDDAFTLTRAERDALPADELLELHMPHAVLQEEVGAMLDAIAQDDALRERLYMTRATPERVQHLRLLLDALRIAQRRWTRLRVASDAQALQTAVAQAERLRADILEAVDYSLDHDRVALERIAQIRKGEGVPDLIEDLGDLKVLLEDFEEVMRADKLFGYDATLHAIDDTLAALVPARAVTILDVDRRQAKDDRDRAWTLALRATRALRHDARRAFSKDPVSLSFFQSRYELDYNRRARQRAAQSP